MSKTLTNARHVALVAQIDVMVNDVVKLKIKEQCDIILVTVKYELNHAVNFSTGDPIDIYLNEKLDNVDELILYFTEHKDSPSYGSEIITPIGDITIESQYIGNYILFQGTNVNIQNDTDYSAPIRSEIHIEQNTPIQTVIVPAVGVTINSIDSIKTIYAQFGVVTLKKVGANVWSLFGALG